MSFLNVFPQSHLHCQMSSSIWYLRPQPRYILKICLNALLGDPVQQSQVLSSCFPQVLTHLPSVMFHNNPISVCSEHKALETFATLVKWMASKRTHSKQRSFEIHIIWWHGINLCNGMAEKGDRNKNNFGHKQFSWNEGKEHQIIFFSSQHSAVRQSKSFGKWDLGHKIGPLWDISEPPGFALAKWGTCADHQILTSSWSHQWCCCQGGY